MRNRARVLSAVVFAVVSWSGASVSATNGYFQPGTGTQSKGMAGAGSAILFGPTSPAANPAGIAFGTGGWDVGVALFSPNRDYEVVGNPSGYPGTFGLAPGNVESDSPLFPVPHLGYARSFGRVAAGVLLFANGGMNTNYDAPTFGVAPTGVNLSQMFVAPTVAVKLGEHHAVGATALLAYQMFKAEGLQAFGGFSSDAANLSNRDTASAYGAGVRLGYVGQWSTLLSVAASYQTRIVSTAFDEYKGLFAEQGDFDIPSNFTVGIGLHPTDTIDLALDVQRMNYSEVASVGHPMLPNLMQAALGSDGGAGFGWDDMTVIKAGVQVRPGSGWTLRGGYSYGKQPIGSSEVMWNILAPGVIEQHVTAGFSKTIGKGSLDVSVVRALSHDVTGVNPLEVPGLQSITLRMDQWDIGVGYSFRF